MLAAVRTEPSTMPLAPFDLAGGRALLRRRSPVSTLLLFGAAGLGLGLLGGLGFGLVHVVGGALHGNGRAVSFGVQLAALTGGALVVEAAALRRFAGPGEPEA